MVSTLENKRIQDRRKKQRGLGHSVAKFIQDPSAGVDESVLASAAAHRARMVELGKQTLRLRKGKP